jgi:DnaJ-class molecular chaperone
MASPCTACSGHGYIVVKRRNQNGETVEVMERCTRCGGSGTDPRL